MDRRLKTFATYPPERELLERLSDLLSLARGKNFPEREVFVDALKVYAATAAIDEAERLLAEQLAEIEGDRTLADDKRATRRADLEAIFAVRRDEFLAACERQGIELTPAPKGKKR